MQKPAWVIDKERARREAARETVWLFGLHAVRDALLNPRREKLRLVVTKNALDKLADAVATAAMTPEVVDAKGVAAFAAAASALAPVFGGVPFGTTGAA